MDRDLHPMFPGSPASNADPGRAPRFVPSIGRADLDHLVDSYRAALRKRQRLPFQSIVIGVSGGADSAVAAALTTLAASVECHAVVVDIHEPLDRDIADPVFAVEVCESLGLAPTVIDGSGPYRAHLDSIPGHDLITRIHVRSRVINTLLYQFADSHLGIVVDTTNRSEAILTLFEEGQRGHVAPLAGLYKSEVLVLAELLGLSTVIERKSGCPGLDNADIFGMEWSSLDEILRQVVDVSLPPAEVAARCGVDTSWMERLVERLARQPVRAECIRLPHPGGH